MNVTINNAPVGDAGTGNTFINIMRINIFVGAKRPKLLLKYAFENDPKLKVMKIPLENFGGREKISVEELYTYLVEDRVNLRTVSNIRYSHCISHFLKVV